MSNLFTTALVLQPDGIPQSRQPNKLYYISTTYASIADITHLRESPVFSESMPARQGCTFNRASQAGIDTASLS